MQINSTALLSKTSTTQVTEREQNNGRVSGDHFEGVLKIAIDPKQHEREQIRITERLKERHAMLDAARADPQEAAKLAYGYAHNALGFELLDLSDRPNIRYSATGELVTPKTQAYFAKISQAMQIKSSHLYSSGIAKGTSHTEILEKIFDFHDALPERFKDMLGW